MNSAAGAAQGREWMEVSGYTAVGWAEPARAAEGARESCEALERGRILFFREAPFTPPAEDLKFLLGAEHGESRVHKNISYRPETGVLRGFAGSAEQRQRMAEVMRNFSAGAARFLYDFLAPYAGAAKMDFASFRPLEEEGRDLPLHKRNDLIHVDAFPSRPTRGGRILRIFVNANPAEDRVWRMAPPFAEMAAEYAPKAGLARYAENGGGAVAALQRALGMAAGRRTAYDRFMLHFHDWLKENEAFQADARNRTAAFPPGAGWLVFTDGVPHAVLSGRFALEQTFIVPVEALAAPEAAPVRVLEKLAGRPMRD